MALVFILDLMNAILEYMDMFWILGSHHIPIFFECLLMKSRKKNVGIICILIDWYTIYLIYLIDESS